MGTEIIWGGGFVNEWSARNFQEVHPKRRGRERFSVPRAERRRTVSGRADQQEGQAVVGFIGGRPTYPTC